MRLVPINKVRTTATDAAKAVFLAKATQGFLAQLLVRIDIGKFRSVNFFIFIPPSCYYAKSVPKDTTVKPAMPQARWFNFAKVKRKDVTPPD